MNKVPQHLLLKRDMDQYLDFIVDEAQQPVEESSCVEDDEDVEEVYTS